MIDRHQLLAEYQDERITITGVFERFSFITKQYRDIKTALLQDVYAHIDGKDLDLGHVWLQHADPLKEFDLTFGDRIQCNCRVMAYKKRLMTPNKQGLMFENRLSLCWPTEAKVISRLQLPEVQPILIPNVVTAQITSPKPMPMEPTAKDAMESFNPAKMIMEVRRLAKLAGGIDSLQQLVEALRTEA